MIRWSDWQPLEKCWRGDCLPARPGLYKVRCRLHDQLEDTLAYVGQTGTGKMTLKQRLGMLRGVYGEEMPYRDPHTAAPALWAMRHKDDCHFEVSVSLVTGSTQWRKGMEAVTLALYRQQHGRSPMVNFGRMPVGYRMSTCNNSLLTVAGKRRRGGTTKEADLSHAPGIPPVGLLDGPVGAEDWCGHCWSTWEPLASMSRERWLSTHAKGLYRLRRRGESLLLYVGQGWVLDRLMAHGRKALNANDTQGAVFGALQQLECSWVTNNSWLPHQRLELENDLIAAHILNTGEVPAAQFIGVKNVNLSLIRPLPSIPVEVTPP